MKLLSACFVSSLMYGSSEAKTSYGSCPQVYNMADFQPDKYVGKWYEVFRDKWNKYTLGTDCVTREFAIRDDGNINLYFRGYYHWLFSYQGANGVMSDCNEGSADTFTCRATMGGGSKKSPFSIFATDYENYDISYQCEQTWGGWYKTENLAI